MAVQAIGGHVELSALKPLDFGFVEIILQDLVEVLIPVEEFFGPFTPVAFRILQRTFVDVLILLHAFDVSFFAPCLRWLEYLSFLLKTFDLTLVLHTSSLTWARVNTIEPVKRSLFSLFYRRI
jgi:hypothetical protein